MAGDKEVVEINDDNTEDQYDVCLENPDSVKHTEHVNTLEQSFILEADFHDIADKALEEDTTPPRGTPHH